MSAASTVTDEALVAAVAGGDMSALRELYARHGAWLHARLLRRCNDPEIVVEVVQDTFVTLWKDARRFRHEGEVGAWLWGIAFRRMVSRLRVRKDVVLLPEWDVSPLLAIGGVLLLVPRTTGVVFVLAGIFMCAPFWWGFDLPFAWFSAAGVLALLAVAGGAWMLTRPGTASPDGATSRGRTTSHSPVASTQGVRTGESRALRQAGWAGAAAVALLASGVTLCSFAGVDAPGTSDATILERLDDGGKQRAAGFGLPLLSLGVALLLWFATGLRRLVDRLPGGDPLAHAVVPAATLVGWLVITGVSLDVSVAITALASDEFTPDPNLARVLGTAGQLVALTGLAGGAVLVAATTRIAQQASAMPSWAAWASYVVAVLCLTGFLSGGTASVLLGMWLIGAVIALLRTSSSSATFASPKADAPVSSTGGQPHLRV